MPVIIGVGRARLLTNDPDGDSVPDSGDAYTYELIVANTGNADATGVAVNATENGYSISNVLIGPIGVDDTIGVTVAGNTPYTFSAGALTGNDLDPDDGTPSLTITHINGTAIVTGTPIDVGNATVTRNGDGTFTIRPDAGFEGQQTFTYNTVDSDGIASVATTPATVTVNVGEAVWYIDSTGGNDVTGNGTYENPFASLAPLTTGGTADALDDSNDTVFVYANGANAYNSGIALETGQVLRGEGVAADFIVNGITVSSIQTDTQIEYTGIGVQLATGNTILGVDLVGEATGAVAISDDGGVTVGSLTVSDTEISGQGQIIDIDNAGTLNVTLESAASTGSTGANGGVIDLAGVSGTFTVSGATSISGTHSQAAIDVGGGSTSLVMNFAGATSLDMGVQGGVNLSANAGSATFTGLDITTTSGAALAGNAAGTLTVTGGSNDISTTTGTAINLTSVTVGVGGLNFATVSTNGAASGVLLSSVGQAAGSSGIDILGGTIASASARGVDIAFTSADVSVATTISSAGTGRTVEVTDSGRNVAGGSAIVFSGAIDENGSGINLDNNDFNTQGAVISFTGGLDIDSTTSTGFSATNGGTINVTGTNTINNTTGTGLNVQNTTIGASDLTFQQIAVNGAANGIVLNATGSLGGLIVTGFDSGDPDALIDLGSGGTIQNTLGDGILLTSTMDVFLTGMTLSSNDGDGIGGSGVNGFVLDRVTISGNGTSDAADHSGINLNGLTGTAIAGAHPTEIRNSTISNNHEFEVQITNTSGTLTDFRVTNSAISSNGATAVHGNLFNFLSGTGTASMGLTVAGSSFTGSTTLGQLTGAGVFADASGGSVNANIGTSTFTNNNNGVVVSAATNGVLAFNIHDNTITGSRGDALIVFTNANHNATASGTIASNIIGNQAVIASGSLLGRGMRVSSEGTGTTTVLINGNTVQSVGDSTNADPVDGLDGILVIKAVTNGTLNATITNNTIRNIPEDRGLTIQTGNGPGSILNANVSGNTFTNVLGTSHVRLFEGPPPPGTPGFLNITQTSSANFTTVNNGATVTVSGSPQFGQPAPPLPLLAEGVPDAPDDLSPAGGDDATGGTPGDSVVPAVDEPDAPAGGDGDTGGEAVPELPAPSHPVIVDDNVLSQAELDYLREAAITRWIAVGATDEQVAAMRATAFTVADMNANYLAASQPGVVQVDSDGAGHGWFLDGTPSDDAEYQGSGTRLSADGGPAAGSMDLLTVLMHELGHQVGLADIYTAAAAHELMYGYASLGSRRLPAADDLVGAGPAPVGETSFVVLTPTVGTLPQGRAVRVVYTATINGFSNQVVPNPFNNDVTIQGSNFANVISASDTTTVDTLTLGGTVWNDNGMGAGGLADGIKAGLETGINSVAVTLFVDNGTSVGVWDASDIQIATATTAGGDYSFTGLAAGDYIVRIDLANFGVGGALLGTPNSPVSSPEPIDPDDNADNDDNGARAAGDAAYSKAITLAFNTEPTPGPGNDTNTTLDFGFFANITPVVDLNTGSAGVNDSNTYTEGGPAAAIGTAIAVTDFGGDLIESATITITDAIAGDALSVSPPLPGGIVASGDGSTTVTLTGAASPATYAAALAQIFYYSSSDNPTAFGTDMSRSITVVVNDGEANSATATMTMAVVDTNDAPVLTVQDDTVSGTEDVPLLFQAASSNAITVSDVDDASLTVTLTVLNGTLTLSQTTGLAVTGNGTLTVQATGTAADLNLALEGLAYLGDLNFEGSDTLSVQVDDGDDTDTQDIAILLADDGTIDGNSGNNVLNGTPGVDFFDLSQGGNDTAFGYASNDGFYMGSALSALDNLDGGDGSDQVGLQGNYGSSVLPFVLGAGNLINIESLVLLPGTDSRFGDTSGAAYDYYLATADANVGLGQTLTINFNTLGPDEDVFFDGSLESDGSFLTYAGRGNDTIIGGAQNDGFYFGNNGRWSAGDSVNGGGGSDQLGLQGSYTVTFGATQLIGVESLALMTGGDARFGNPAGVGYSYNLTMNDGNVAALGTMIVNANTLRANVPGVIDETLTFNGAAELNGTFTIFSGAGNDIIAGGQGDDQIWGGLGGDTLTGNGGGDTFHYATFTQSRAIALGFDRLIDFDDDADKIDLPTGVSISAFAGATTGALSSGTMATTLEGTYGGLGLGQAALFTADGGTLDGRTFLLINANGVAGFQATGDFVIELVNPTAIDNLGMFI